MKDKKYTYKEIKRKIYEKGISVDTEIIDYNHVGIFNYDLFPEQKLAIIFYMEVDKKHRKKGIAKSIIDQFACEMKCNGYDTIELHYMNDKTKKIWSKLGFIQTPNSIEMKMSIKDIECICNTIKQ